MRGSFCHNAPGNRASFSYSFSFLTIVAIGTLCLLAGCGGTSSIPLNNSASASPTPTPMPAAATKVFATDSFEGLFVFNVQTNSVSRLPISGAPSGIVLTPDGSRAYVTQQASVAVIDTRQNAIVAEIPIATAQTTSLLPMPIAMSPDGKFAYVANTNNGMVVVIDTASNAVVNTINTDSAPSAIAFSADGKQAYVSLLEFDGGIHVGGPNPENALLVIDTATRTIVKKFPQLAIQVLAVSPSRHEMYAAEGGLDLFVISTDTNQIIAQMTLDNDQVTGMAVSADGKLIYLTEHGMEDLRSVPSEIVPSTVWVFRTDTLATVAKAHTDPGLSAIALSPDGNTAYLLEDETVAAGMRTMNTRDFIFGPVQPLAGSPESLAVSSH